MPTPHHHRLVWFIAIPILAGIVAVWAWNFRYVLRSLPSGGQFGSIGGLLQKGVHNTASDLAAAQKKIDEQLRKIHQAAAAASAHETTIQELKKKVEAGHTTPKP